MISTTFELDSEFNSIVEACQNGSVTLSEALDNITRLSIEAGSCGIDFDVRDAESRLRFSLELPERDDV